MLPDSCSVCRRCLLSCPLPWLALQATAQSAVSDSQQPRGPPDRSRNLRMGTRACRMRSTWPRHSRLAWMRLDSACGVVVQGERIVGDAQSSPHTYRQQGSSDFSCSGCRSKHSSGSRAMAATGASTAAAVQWRQQQNGSSNCNQSCSCSVCSYAGCGQFLQPLHSLPSISSASQPACPPHPQELDLHLPLHAIHRHPLHLPGLVPPAGSQAGRQATHQFGLLGSAASGLRQKQSTCKYGSATAEPERQSQPTTWPGLQCSGPGRRAACTTRSQTNLQRHEMEDSNLSATGKELQQVLHQAGSC